MNRVTSLITVSAMLIAAGGFLGCDRNLFRARVHVNRGSCLMAVDKGITAVRKYAEERGHLPGANANLAELGEFSVLPEIASRLQYGGSDSLSLKSPERIIVVKCVFSTSSPNGVAVFYCALLSGEIVLLQEKDALVGKLCPPGAGTVVLPKP